MKRLLKELDFVIPYEVIFYTGINKEGEILTKVADVKDSKNRKDSIKDDFKGTSFKFKKEITLRNEEFKLEYIPDSNIYGNVLLKVTKKGLNEKFFFHYSREDFGHLFEYCPWMINGELGDSYCIRLGSDKGSRGYPYFVSERCNDILDFKEAGRVINQEHQTSLWIPGHVYLLKDYREFIYLGELNDPWRIGDYWGNRGCSAHTSLFDTGWNTKLTKLKGTFKYGLIVEHANYDFLNNLVGLSLPEAIYKILSPGKLNKEVEPWLLEQNSKMGYDLGEFIKQIKNDTRTLPEIIEDTARDIIKDQKKLKDTDFEHLSVTLKQEIPNNKNFREEFEKFVLQEFRTGLSNYRKGYGGECKKKPSLDKVLEYVIGSNAPYNFPDDILKTYHLVIGSISEEMKKEIQKNLDKVYDTTI